MVDFGPRTIYIGEEDPIKNQKDMAVAKKLLPKHIRSELPPGIKVM